LGNKRYGMVKNIWLIYDKKKLRLIQGMCPGEKLALAGTHLE
jgi:hypothetical protein